MLDQWKRELEKFLTIEYELEEQVRKRGRKKRFSPIGTLSSTGDTLHGIIDVAIMQSCITDNEVKPFVRNYGMVIVDECHHVSAVSFEQVLKTITAQRVYGLTATPTRKDGHQPIIFMQCGPIRYSADAKSQMKSQSFERLLVPRFTPYRLLSEDKPSYAQTIQQLSEDEFRNRLIVNDVCEVLKERRSPIILTNLTSHVFALAELLKPHCKNVITLVGSESAKEKRQKQEWLLSIPATEPLVIVATGKYVGEGFFSELTTTSDIIYDGKSFIKPFIDNLTKAKQSIILSCPKIKIGRYSLIADKLAEMLTNGVAIQIFTKDDNTDVVKLRTCGITVTLKPDINFNCCIIDRSDIWYGSVNILGYHSAEDNMITFHDAETAKDILELLYR